MLQILVIIYANWSNLFLLWSSGFGALNFRLEMQNDLVNGSYCGSQIRDWIANSGLKEIENLHNPKISYPEVHLREKCMNETIILTICNVGQKSCENRK